MQSSQLLSLSRAYLSRIGNIKKGDILTLREVIREHNRLYHIAESPIIGDTEYDQLFHALARAESDYDMLDADSPTARLAILAGDQFQKVAHRYPMISLDNTYNMQEIREFEWRIDRVLKDQRPKELWYYIQPKYDGLGLAVVYEYGKLKQAITRGSGVEWEDVTLTAWEIENLPKEISELKKVERMEIRGEVVMSRTEFNRINTERLLVGDKLFANPRNCASGSLRQLDPLVTRSRKLQFFAYSTPSIEQWIGNNFGITRYSRMMHLLENSWGFVREDLPYIPQDLNFYWLDLDAVVATLEEETANRVEHFDFDIDGMVIKLDDMTLWNDLGRTEHHPRYAIAYKFPAKQVRTRVVSIEHSVGRTGTVTPVANLEAVDVGGVIVRRATLHNYDELTRKWVRIWDSVFIMRAGEVIPEIVSVIVEVRDGSEQEVEIPKNCPICSTLLTQDDGKIAIWCPNIHCPAKIQGQLEMFVGRQAMNIDGLGPRQIEDFLEQGWITDFASVFQLGRYQDQILELDGYKEKSVQNLIDSLEKSRHTTLDRMLVGLGIPNIGKKTGRLLANAVKSEKLLKSIPWGTKVKSTETSDSTLSHLFSITEEDLLEVKDIGPETARSFVEYMSENREVVERLYGELEIQIPLTLLRYNSSPKSGELKTFIKGESQEKISSMITGKSFCVTGSFDTLSRDEIHELIEKHGGEVRTSVSAKLDYLIAGENAGSKKSKAEECAVSIIAIDEFLIMVG